MAESPPTKPTTPFVWEGYIEDFISGLPVRATPEEVEAVQVFAHRLVEDLGHEKDQIKTRPQYMARRTPSDSRRSYPVDLGRPWLD